MRIVAGRKGAAMGTLMYGTSGMSFEFPDRVLWHLQIVITAKLRRGESFNLSWGDSVQLGSGRNSIWLSPSSTLFYRYFGSKTPSTNRLWINALMVSANSPGGLVISTESSAIEHAGTVE
jgi:hypothetical protein